MPPQKRKGKQASLSHNTQILNQRLAEETQDRLFGLAGELQGLDTELLTGLQRDEVCAFFVGISQRELARTFFLVVDVFLRELQTGVQDGHIGTEGLCSRVILRDRRIQAGDQVIKRLRELVVGQTRARIEVGSRPLRPGRKRADGVGTRRLRIDEDEDVRSSKHVHARHVQERINKLDVLRTVDRGAEGRRNNGRSKCNRRRCRRSAEVTVFRKLRGRGATDDADDRHLIQTSRTAEDDVRGLRAVRTGQQLLVGVDAIGRQTLGGNVQTA